MYSNTLTFPTPLADLSPRTDPRLRIPNLLQGLKAALPRRHSPPAAVGARLEQRLRRTAARGLRIVLGTAEQPYEPLALSGAPLAALLPFEGLEVAITTGSPEILEQLDLLAELDQRHAVTVDLLAASLDPVSPDLRERLRAVAALSAEGLTARLVVAAPPGLEQGLPSPAVGHDPTWKRLVHGLRLEHGFPRSLPGRG